MELSEETKMKLWATTDAISDGQNKRKLIVPKINFQKRKNTMNVFELNTAIKQVQEKNLDPETLADTLESLELPRNEKLDNVASWIEENNMKLNWLKEKIKQLSEVEASIKKQTENLQEFLTQAIDDSGQKEIQTENHILKPRNYKDSVIVEETKKLPIDYIIRTETIRPDKKKIYEDLKAGKSISSAHLKHNRRTTIK